MTSGGRYFHEANASRRFWIFCVEKGRWCWNSLFYETDGMATRKQKWCVTWNWGFFVCTYLLCTSHPYCQNRLRILLCFRVLSRFCYYDRKKNVGRGFKQCKLRRWGRYTMRPWECSFERTTFRITTQALMCRLPSGSVKKVSSGTGIARWSMKI